MINLGLRILIQIIGKDYSLFNINHRINAGFVSVVKPISRDAVLQ